MLFTLFSSRDWIWRRVDGSVLWHLTILIVATHLLAYMLMFCNVQRFKEIIPTRQLNGRDAFIDAYEGGREAEAENIFLC